MASDQATGIRKWPAMGMRKWPTVEMRKQDSSWRRVRVCCVVQCLVMLVLLGNVGCVGGKQMSETLQRALSAVRGPSPGAKKLLNIPEDGGM